MSDVQQEPGLLEHSYDGIQELDNPMPGWMTVILLGSIVFSIGYVWYFHYGPGKSFAAVYNEDHAAYSQKLAVRKQAEAAAGGEDVLAAKAKDASALAAGEKIFKEKCVACHAANGEGVVGPNLTDMFHKNGTTRQDIFKVVSEGVPGTAMTGFSAQLPSVTDVLNVAAYVVSLRGKNLPGKAPEGAAVQMFAE